MSANLSPQELNARLDHMGNLLEKLIQVNGFFITAGYGTFFGVWTIVKDELPLQARLWSCLFLLVSAALFVLWHLYGLLAMNEVIHSIADEPAEGKIARTRAALRDRNLKILPRFGIPITLTSAVLAFIGVCILATGLISSL